MREQHVRLILAAAYYDPRHARFVAERTNGTVVAMANEVQSRPGTDDYLALVDYDVRTLVAAAGKTGTP